MWPTPCVHGNYNRAGLSENSGDGLATAVRMWSTPSSADCKGSHGGGQGRSLRTDIHDLARKYSEVKSVGSLNPAWVEILMGYPLGWTDPDCDEPEPWPGWPAMMSCRGEDEIWPTPQASTGTNDLNWEATDVRGRPNKIGWGVRVNQNGQYPYEPPRTCTGIPNRAARLKALGNSVVPAQAYPFFEAIAIMEEVRQCNTASSTYQDGRTRR